MDQHPNIHTVSQRDGAYVFHRGEGFERYKLPSGTRVVYAHDPLPPLADVRATIEHALDHPLDCEPLAALLKPGMKITIAFDDISLPIPRMVTPDIRQLMAEAVLKRLDDAGVTDIHIINAICLHRRNTPKEMRRMFGHKIYDRFAPDRLYNHDAEDPEKLTDMGKTETGEDVEINRRAAESDLLIYLNINLVSMDGGHKSVPVGLSTYKSVRHHHNVKTMLTSCSYMDPDTSSFHKSCDRMGDVVRKYLRIFQIESTLNNNMYPGPLKYLQKREADWNIFDHIGFQAGRLGLKMLPGTLRRKAYSALPSPYGVTGVHAGETGAVHAKTLENVFKQYAVPVEGQADILLIGLPSLGPYNVNSILNPVLVHCLALGYFFNFYRGKPLVKKGGVVILSHPIENKFHMVHHPSYYDFFNEVLTQTRDPKELEQKYEESYAQNDRYRELYRKSYAYHGVHPFYMWYWGCHGADHVGRTIAIAPDSDFATRTIGYESAPTLDAAIADAKTFLGNNDPQITYFHCPPVVQVDVT